MRGSGPKLGSLDSCLGGAAPVRNVASAVSVRHFGGLVWVALTLNRPIVFNPLNNFAPFVLLKDCTYDLARPVR